MSVMITTGFVCSAVENISEDNANPFKVELTVGDGQNFVKDYLFNGERGTLRCHFNQRLIDEAGVQVSHNTKEHHGTVVFKKRTNITNVAPKGSWTKRYDVRVDDEDAATYTALY